MPKIITENMIEKLREYNTDIPEEVVRGKAEELCRNVCGDSDIFAAKSDHVYQHIVDQALMGYAWVA